MQKQTRGGRAREVSTQNGYTRRLGVGLTIQFSDVNASSGRASEAQRGAGHIDKRDGQKDERQALTKVVKRRTRLWNLLTTYAIHGLVAPE